MTAQREYSPEELLPMAAPMILLQEILSYSDEELNARLTISPASMFFANTGVPCTVGLEYMAQAMGCWQGVQFLSSGQKPVPGLLLGASGFVSEVDFFADGQTYRVSVKHVFTANGMGVFDCAIHDHTDKQVVQAELKAYVPENIDEFIEETARQ